MSDYAETHKPGKIFIIKYRALGCKEVFSHRMMFCDHETEDDARKEWLKRRANVVIVSIAEEGE